MVSSPVAGKPSPTKRVLDALVVLVVPLATALVLVAVLAGERAGPAGDLQLIAPSQALPGSHVAIRALFLAHPDAPEGPELVDATGSLVAIDLHGTTVARVPLRRTAARSLEGVLALPASFHGPLALEATATDDHGDSAPARLTLEVTRDAQPLPHSPRALSPTAMLRLEAPRANESADAGIANPILPSLEVRIAGGVCVPETTCDVLVRANEQVSVRLARTASVEPGAVTPVADVVGVTRLRATVHGPEGASELVVSRDGREFCRATIRLPVALGEPALSVLAGGHLRVDGGEPGRGVIVDLFDARGFWMGTATVDAARAVHGTVFPLALPTTGRVVLQARTDPYGSDSAAVRVVDLPVRDDDLDAAFARANLEVERYATPRGESGRPDDDARIAETRSHVRLLAVIALMLAALVLGAWITARGLHAAKEARALALAAGDEHAEDATAKRRDWLTVLAIVCLVLLLFAAAIAFVLARTAL